MAKTLKEITGKTVEDLVREYDAVAKDIDMWHDMLEVRASGHPDKEMSNRAAFIVSLLRETEFHSERYLKLISLYNFFMKK